MPATGLSGYHALVLLSRGMVAVVAVVMVGYGPMERKVKVAVAVVA